MTLLTPWREELRPLIPRGFLRRDQGDQLLASDYPRHDGADAITAAIQAAGYQIFIERGIARMDGSRKKYAALISTLPPIEIPPPTDGTLPLHALALRLVRAQTPFQDQPIAPIRLTLKCLDAGDFSALLRQLPPQLALLQRHHQPLPAAAGHLIFSVLANSRKGDGPLC